MRDAGALDAGPSDAGVSPVTEGKGYVTNRECQGCHEETLSGSPTCQQGEPANLTSTGLGKWSDLQIITAVRTGVDDQGTMLSTDMPRFSTMSDHEVTSIVAFLRSLPAVVRPGCERDGADAGVHQGSDGGVARADAGTPRLDAGVPGGCTTNSVVISQVYGGGGNIGARFNADYIELHNRSSHAVELGGWAIQYSSAAGTSWKSQLATIPSPTRLKAGTYVLLAIGPTGVKGASLPVTAVKLSKQVDMSATNGKVALTMDSVALEGDCPIGPSVADFVGYGTASCSEGGSAASPLSSALAAGRLLEAGAEMACVDTDTNASDFSKIAPQPHGSAKNICSCPK